MYRRVSPGYNIIRDERPHRRYHRGYATFVIAQYRDRPKSPAPLENAFVRLVQERYRTSSQADHIDSRSIHRNVGSGIALSYPAFFFLLFLSLSFSPNPPAIQLERGAACKIHVDLCRIFRSVREGERDETARERERERERRRAKAREQTEAKWEDERVNMLGTIEAPTFKVFDEV